MKTKPFPLLGPLLVSTLLGLPQAYALDAFTQNQKLGRGINILGYDPIWQSKEHARFKAEYFPMLKQAGFDSMRINLHPFRHMNLAPDAGFKIKDSWFAVADWAVDTARTAGLVVILDLHEYQAMGEAPAAHKEKFLAAWRQLAGHFQRAPESVLFEILNEPNKNLTPELWNDYLREVLPLIRQTNPARTLIVGPAYWNAIEHLDELDLPSSETNVIVTVHYYKPMDFTHQGAVWANRGNKLGVEWQASEAELAVINRDFDKANSWANAHHRPMFLGEFGAYEKAPMDSRGRYIRSIARAAEQRKWSWAYWQFDSDFIIYDVKHDEWVEPLRRALFLDSGLKSGS